MRKKKFNQNNLEDVEELLNLGAEVHYGDITNTDACYDLLKGKEGHYLLRSRLLLFQYFYLA